MKRICIVTATRAEYGLLKNIIMKLLSNPEFQINVVATGMHLSPEFGLTYHEIEQDGIRIDKKINMLLSGDTPASVSKSMGLALISFADYFAENTPDLLLVLGDRYETLAVCIAAMNQQIPIAHLYGGETTEGAIDEAIRHAITKLSYLHFTSTDEYRKRVIQLGEHPDRVFCVGALGVENIITQPFMSRQELEENLHFSLKEAYAMVTFHPVTLENGMEKQQTEELLAALAQFVPMNYIITKANADAGGRSINEMIDKFAAQYPDRALVIDSLGMKRYLSALQYCTMVIGNSSSGLVEAPSMHIPTINIGNRQKGRIRAASVIDCIASRDYILEAMKLALTKEMKKIVQNVINPYGDGKTSVKIVEILESFLKKGIDLKKKFYELKFTNEI